MGLESVPCHSTGPSFQPRGCPSPVRFCLGNTGYHLPSFRHHSWFLELKCDTVLFHHYPELRRIHPGPLRLTSSHGAMCRLTVLAAHARVLQERQPGVTIKPRVGTRVGAAVLTLCQWACCKVQCTRRSGQFHRRFLCPPQVSLSSLPPSGSINNPGQCITGKAASWVQKDPGGKMTSIKSIKAFIQIKGWQVKYSKKDCSRLKTGPPGPKDIAQLSKIHRPRRKQGQELKKKIKGPSPSH